MFAGIGTMSKETDTVFTAAATSRRVSMTSAAPERPATIGAPMNLPEPESGWDGRPSRSDYTRTESQYGADPRRPGSLGKNLFVLDPDIV
jgi:hypothetical protein